MIRPLPGRDPWGLIEDAISAVTRRMVPLEFAVQWQQESANAWIQCPDSRRMIRLLAMVDQRNGVAAAAMLARTALPVEPEFRLCPLRAIEAAEAWAREPTEDHRLAAHSAARESFHFASSCALVHPALYSASLAATAAADAADGDPADPVGTIGAAAGDAVSAADYSAEALAGGTPVRDESKRFVALGAAAAHLRTRFSAPTVGELIAAAARLQ